MSKKVLVAFIIAVLIVLSLGIRLMYAQSGEMVNYEVIMKRLNLILENQVQMKEDLETIKLSVARI